MNNMEWIRSGKAVGSNYTTQDGIFYFDADTNTEIDTVGFSGASRLQTKQLNMLGYLWEIGYDLCVAPGSNISGSAGFEALNGER